MTTTSLVASEPERAFARLYRRYYDHLLHYAMTMVEADDAVDIVHDAFIKLLARAEEEGAFPAASRQRSLVFAMVHDCAINHQERTGIIGRAMHRVSGATAAMRRWSTTPRREEDREIARVVHPAIAALRPSWRQVVTLICQEELKTSEVAVVMGIKEATVRAHLVRATDALRFQLTQAGMTPAPPQRRRS